MASHGACVSPRPGCRPSQSRDCPGLVMKRRGSASACRCTMPRVTSRRNNRCRPRIGDVHSRRAAARAVVHRLLVGECDHHGGDAGGVRDTVATEYPSAASRCRPGQLRGRQPACAVPARIIHQELRQSRMPGRPAHAQAIHVAIGRHASASCAARTRSAHSTLRQPEADNPSDRSTKWARQDAKLAPIQPAGIARVHAPQEHRMPTAAGTRCGIDKRVQAPASRAGVSMRRLRRSAASHLAGIALPRRAVAMPGSRGRASRPTLQPPGAGRITGQYHVTRRRGRRRAGLVDVRHASLMGERVGCTACSGSAPASADDAPARGPACVVGQPDLGSAGAGVPARPGKRRARLRRCHRHQDGRACDARPRAHCFGL